jgi:hypothetical protein
MLCFKKWIIINNVKQITLYKIKINMLHKQPVYFKIDPENDNGNVEYKWSLADINNTKLHKTASQMKWRVWESYKNKDIQTDFLQNQPICPHAYYLIGVYNDGRVVGLDNENFIKTYKNLLKCAHIINMRVSLCWYKSLDKDNKYKWALFKVFTDFVQRSTAAAAMPPVQTKSSQDDFFISQTSNNKNPNFINYPNFQ